MRAPAGQLRQSWRVRSSARTWPSAGPMPLLPERAGRAAAPILRALPRQPPCCALCACPAGGCLIGVGGLAAVAPGPGRVPSAAVVRAAGCWRVSRLPGGSPGRGNPLVHHAGVRICPLCVNKEINHLKGGNQGPNRSMYLLESLCAYEIHGFDLIIFLFSTITFTINASLTEFATRTNCLL